MNRILIAVLVAYTTVTIAWLGRYHIAAGSHGYIYKLDRWTGNVEVAGEFGGFSWHIIEKQTQTLKFDVDEALKEGATTSDTPVKAAPAEAPAPVAP